MALSIEVRRISTHKINFGLRVTATSRRQLTLRNTRLTFWRQWIRIADDLPLTRNLLCYSESVQAT